MIKYLLRMSDAKKYGLEKNPVIRVIEGNVASEKDMLQTQKTHILNENMTQ